MKPVSQAEFARQCGLSRQRINQLVKQGRIPTNEKGRIDPQLGAQWREATESPEPHHQARKAQIEAEKAAQAAAQPPGLPAQHLQQSEAGLQGVEKIGAALKLETYKLQKHKAEKARMEAEKLAGNLLDRQDVERVLADFGATLRAKLEGMPDRLAGAIAAHRGEATAIHRELESAAEEILTEIADTMKRKMEDVAA